MQIYIKKLVLTGSVTGLRRRFNNVYFYGKNILGDIASGQDHLGVTVIMKELCVNYAP